MAEWQVIVLGRDGHYALWPNHMSLGPPMKQMLQRSLRLLAMKKTMPVG